MMSIKNMKKTIYLKLDIDLDIWKGYEDVSDELTVEDAMENYLPKDGTTLTVVEVAWKLPEYPQHTPILGIVGAFEATQLEK